MFGLFSWLIFLLLLVTKTHSHSDYTEWSRILEHRHRELEEQEPKCVYNPCQNGGTCTAYHDRFHCTCKKGWIGDNCERRSICYPNPCIHGRCSASLEGFTCTCQTGYKGELCDAIQHCHPNPCWHGGSCTESSSNVYCDCQSGFRGRYCEFESKCSPNNPCVNGGVCREERNNHDYYCICSAPYTGINCELATPPTPETSPEKSTIASYEEGPQAIPSPEINTEVQYGNRALSELIKSNNGNSMKNDISLGKSIFSPTLFDPPPFGGEVKDPIMNSLHKVTVTSLTPEIYKEIKAEKEKAMFEESKYSGKKINAEKLTSDNSKENIFFTSTNSSSKPIAAVIDQDINAIFTNAQERSEVSNSTLNNLKSQVKAETNGTKRSLFNANELKEQHNPCGKSNLTLTRNDTEPTNKSLQNNNQNVTKAERKKPQDVTPDTRSDVSLLRMRGNIVSFRKGSHKLSKNFIKMEKKNPYNLMSTIQRLNYMNGTGVSFLRTRGNVVRKWSHKFLNNTLDTKKDKNKTPHNSREKDVTLLNKPRGISGVNITRSNKSIAYTISKDKNKNISYAINRHRGMQLNFTSPKGNPSSIGYNGTLPSPRGRYLISPKGNPSSIGYNRTLPSPRGPYLISPKGNPSSIGYNGTLPSPRGRYLISATRSDGQAFYFWPKSDMVGGAYQPTANVASKMQQLPYMPPNIPYATGGMLNKLNYFPTNRNVPYTTTAASSDRRVFYVPQVAPYATSKISLNNDFFPPAQTLMYKITNAPKKHIINSQKQLLSFATNQRRPSLRSSSIYMRNSTNMNMIHPRNITELSTDNIIDTSKNKECPNFCQSFCDPWCQSIGCCVATNDQLKAIRQFEQKFTPPNKRITVPKDKACSKCHPYSDCVDGHCLCKKGYFGNGNKCFPLEMEASAWSLPIPVK